MRASLRLGRRPVEDAPPRDDDRCRQSAALRFLQTNNWVVTRARHPLVLLVSIVLPRKSASLSAGSPKRSLTKPDNDLPEVTDEALARADLRVGGKLIRRGRPPLGAVSKESVTLRIDPDIIA